LRIGKLKVNRKAVSPVIATLLMIAIAVAAAILVYVWSMGLVGTLQGTGGQQTREQLIMEAYDATSSTSWKLYIRNVGPASISVTAVYVEGVPAAFSLNPTGPISPGKSANLTVTVPASLTLASGAAYTAKIVTSSGAVFSYSVIYGRAS
jgi:flagellin-like protein